MALIVVNKLSVAADIGECCIELCLGDVTKLQREQAVDVLVVSAFSGDYTPTASSVIGALNRNLGISMRNLARDKEEDLRRNFFCWWSKPLPEQYSYKRILCFEGGFGGGAKTPPQTVGAVFRCLVPILNNKEGTVMMPLLASGDQGYSKELMLRLLVQSAVKWMKAGLPLRSLKIVVYSPNPNKAAFSENPVFQRFEKLKEDLGEKEVESTAIKEKFDLYLSHSSEDHNTALDIVKMFKNYSKDLRVFCKVQFINTEKSWQNDMFEAISSCSRVIVLLTPSFVEADYCIEQYNIALCIGRKLHREFLAPFFIAPVTVLPTYMELVQYIDCRTRCAEKMEDAVVTVTTWFQFNGKETASETLQPTSPASEFNTYDVFISYSHSDKFVATQILEFLQELDSTLKIFIDSAELKAGSSWQETLYHAIESSKRVVTLLSTPYLNSKVCREEFSLALALALDKKSELQLTSLMIEELSHLPIWCSEPSPVDCVCGEGVDKTRLKTVCEDLVHGIENRLEATGYQENDESEKSGNLSLHELSEMFRKTCFATRNSVAEALSVTNLPENEQRILPSVNDLVDSSALEEKEAQNQQPHPPVLALSYAPEDGIFAAALKRFLLEKDSDIKIGEGEAKSSARLSLLDEADLIVLFLSPAFLSAKHLVDELNIALFRHRSSSNQVVFPVRVAELPDKPAYVHLIPCEFSMLDVSWSLEHHNNCPAEVKRLADDLGLAYDIALCLRNVADAIVQQLKQAKNDFCGQVLLSPAEIKHDMEALKKKKENEKCGRKDLTCLPVFSDSHDAKQCEESKSKIEINQTCVGEKPLVEKPATQDASNLSLHYCDVEKHSDTVVPNPRSNTCQIV